MKKTVVLLFVLFTLNLAYAQNNIQLPPPSADRGSSVMKALQERRSSRSYDTRELSLQDLSDIAWAALGVNREDGKLTAPTAQNSQDVDLYVCTVQGVYLYDAPAHALDMVLAEDIRPLLEGRRPTGAPVCLLLISDMSRYRGYAPDSAENKHYYEMGAVDCGIVSQNISLFCAGIGLATVPRAGMDQQGIREKLALSDTRHIWLNHPVGYPGE